MNETDPKKTFHGYVSPYLNLPVRTMDEAQRDQAPEQAVVATAQSQQKPKE
jgi:hypothetical protein